MSLLPEKFYLDDFFDDFVPMPKMPKNQMKCDIYEKGGKVHIELDVPGFNKEDVKVDIEDDILKISYTKPEEEKELHPGTIVRGLSKKSFNLGYKISSKYDLSKAEGKLENGLLEIFIPLTEKTKPKAIKIK